MKNLYKGLLCLTLFIVFSDLYAQPVPLREPDYNKPLMFQALPERLLINITNLENLLVNESGNQVSFPFTPGQSLQGVVTSVGRDDPRVESIMVRLTNFNGAGLFISKITRPDGSYYYNGRIISMGHGDAYEIIYEKGLYYFEKKGFYDMLNE